MHRTRSQREQIDSFQARALRTILQLPRRTSGNAVRHILGQTRLSSARGAKRISNMLRMQNLPKTTRLRQLFDSRKWHTRPFYFHKCEKDLSLLSSTLKHTSYNEDDLNTSVANGNLPSSRETIKNIIAQADTARTAHELRINHPELLHFTPSHFNPLWESPRNIACLHARWLTGKTKADDFCNAAATPRCPLCKTLQGGRSHLLSNCPNTTQVREQFERNLREICQNKYEEFRSCSANTKMAWLLAGGTYKGESPDPRTNNRVPAIRSPFLAGESVEPMHGQKDPVNNWIAYNQYKEIENGLPMSIRVFPDGSAPHGQAGLGLAIHSPLGDHTASVPLGKGTSAMAELQAIHRALQIILTNKRLRAEPRLPIHVFTDCKYARNALLTPTPRKKHFLLIEDIKSMASRLRFDLKMPVTLHWIPSHIEKTIYGERPIVGNVQADEQATLARNMSEDEDVSNQIYTIRTKIQHIVTRLLRQIEQLLEPENEAPLPPDGPSSDDIDSDVNASQEFPNSCDT